MAEITNYREIAIKAMKNADEFKNQLERTIALVEKSMKQTDEVSALYTVATNEVKLLRMFIADNGLTDEYNTWRGDHV